MADNSKIIIDIELRGDGSVDVNRLDKSLEQLNKETKKTESSIKKMITALKEQRAEVLMTDEAYERLTDEINRYEKSLKKGTSATNINTAAKKKNAKSSNDMRDKTGLAGAAVVEIGRTISDSNYGFTAMANNISQLGTLFTTLIATTGGLKNGFRALISAFSGPLGVIVVFQIVVALLERFALKAKKSKEGVDSLAKSIGAKGGLISELKLLGEIMAESSKDSAEFQNALSQLKKKGFDPATQSVDDFIEAQIRLLKLQASKGFYEKEIQKIQEELIPLQKELAEQAIATDEAEKKALAAISSSEKGNAVALASALSARDDYNEALAKSGELVKKQTDLEKDYKEILKKIREEFGGISKSISELDFDDEIRKQLRDNSLAVEQNEMEKIKLKEKYAREDVDIQFKAFEAKMNILKLEKGANTELINSRIEEARRGAELFKSVISVGFGIEARQFGLDLVNDIREGVKLASASEVGGSELSPDEILNAIIGTDEQVEEIARKKAELIVKQFNANSLADELNLWADSFSNVFDFVDSEFQRQLDSQQAYTNEQNNILREQLNNENLSAEGRKKIQGQIAANDEKSRQKQDEIKKKRFMANKAFGIAEAGINTYSAALKVLNDPTLVGQPWLRIPMAASTIGFGLTQMAMIARQKFVPTASSTPIAGGGGSGSGGGDRVFDFNLVGESPESQLNRTIQNQFDKPLQAYVVSKDISSQQELDLNIRNSAKI
jgi:hypothetical protein